MAAFQYASQERDNIISAFVNLIAIRGVEGLFEFDHDAYAEFRSRNGDLDEYVKTTFKDNARVYCSELGIEWIRPFSQRKLLCISGNLKKVLRTQTYSPDAGTTKREWLRLKLSQCIDPVFSVSVPVLKALDFVEDVDRELSELANEHEAMLERHRQENRDWERRKRENDSGQFESNTEYYKQEKECRQTLDAIKKGLFDPSEGGFKQYVHR
mgnify:CR=1 FL=1